MASSLIGGLLRAGWPAAQIAVADPDVHQRERVASLGPIMVTENNAAAADNASLVVLAVKPQKTKAVLNELGPTLGRSSSLLLSIVAGIQVATIEAWAGTALAVVRAMPNTPALIGKGASAFWCNPRVDTAGRKLAKLVLDAAGISIEVDEESQLNAVTALSGSGPAYYFRMIEAMIDAGESLGLPRKTAEILALATAEGAAAMATQEPHSPEELRKRVTSPGGTTAAALDVFEAARFDELILRALRKARDRAVELAGGE